MKKRGTVLLVGMLLLCLCACGEKDMEVTPPPSVEPPAVTADPTVTPTMEPSEDVELFQAFLGGEVAAVVGATFTTVCSTSELNATMLGNMSGWAVKPYPLNLS